MKWTWSDAWLLMAIHWSSSTKGALLPYVLSSGDMMNRAIFTLKEVKDGLRKLSAVGYVRFDQSWYCLTPRFQKDYKKLGKHPGDFLAAIDQMYEFLGQKELAGKLPLLSPEIINKKIMDTAYQEYIHRYDQVKKGKPKKK